MALKSWSIHSFAGAEPGSEVTEELIDSGTNTIIVLSLLIASRAAESATVTVKRLSSTNVVKFEWKLILPVLNSPVVLDSKMVFADGDKLSVTSDREHVSVEASGSED